VVILTEELWRSRFGGAPIVNRTIVLDETPRTVIGILPKGAWLFRDDTFFVPAVLRPGTDRLKRAGHWALVLGRLKPQVTLQQADTDLKRIKRQLESQYPTFKKDWGVALQPLPDMVGGPSRPAVLILLGAVSLVLFIACANVAGLLLARGCQRQQEIAVRAALGASATRIVRQVLTESVVLAFVGGLAGLVVTGWGIGLLRQLTADLLPPALAPRLDLRVLAFSMIVTALTGLLFGLLPAWRARRPDLNDTLKNGGKNATSGGRQRTQSALVIGEVAITVVLLTSAGLLLRSLANTATADAGFDPSRVLAFNVSMPEATYREPAKRDAFMNELLARLRALPGVERAGAGLAVPFSGGGFGEYFRRVDQENVNDDMIGRLNFASPGYLEALGARLLAGRTLIDADLVDKAPRVAVISAGTARTLFGDKPAVGERVNIAAETWQVVGVVADIVDRRLDAPARSYASVPLRSPTSYSILVRTRLAGLGLVDGIRREMARLDPGVALANPRMLGEARTSSMAERRMVLLLVAAFAGAALTLACIGLYGVMAYSVATRRREICIRMALGAVRGDVMRAVVRDGLQLMAVGLGIGLVLAIAAARLLTTQLYQVHSYDPMVLGATIAAVSLVAILATSMPAWRATRFNAIAALRND
jgi:predicted permease